MQKEALSFAERSPIVCRRKPCRMQKEASLLQKEASPYAEGSPVVCRRSADVFKRKRSRLQKEGFLLHKVSVLSACGSACVCMKSAWRLHAVASTFAGRTVQFFDGEPPTCRRSLRVLRVFACERNLEPQTADRRAAPFSRPSEC